jgi:hypothetical protein
LDQVAIDEFRGDAKRAQEFLAIRSEAAALLKESKKIGGMMAGMIVFLVPGLVGLGMTLPALYSFANHGTLTSIGFGLMLASLAGAIPLGVVAENKDKKVWTKLGSLANRFKALEPKVRVKVILTTVKAGLDDAGKKAIEEANSKK